MLDCPNTHVSKAMVSDPQKLATLATGSSSHGTETLHGHDIVCLYGEEWDTPLRTSKHYILRHLARTNRVLYVEYPFHPMMSFRHGRAFARRLGRCWRPLRAAEPGLFVLSPLCPLPYHRASALSARPWVNAVNQRWVMQQVTTAATRLGMRRPIVWLYLPHAIQMIDSLHPLLVVFHVIDRYAAFAGFPADVERLVRLAEARADVVLFSSERLTREFSPRATHHVVRHGADVQLFLTARGLRSEVPPEVTALPRPRVGYYGALHKVDINLIRWCAEQRPTWSFILVGPRSGIQGVRGSDWQRLPSNIHLLGAKPHGELPAYLADWDVVMMPFRVDALTEVMTPIKFYECVAAGKPIVCTDIADAREFPELIRVARTREEFLDAFGYALEHPPSTLPPEVVAGCDWTQRFAQIERIVSNALDEHVAGRS